MRSIREGFLEAVSWRTEAVVGVVSLTIFCGRQQPQNALSSPCVSYREKGSLAHNLQVTQQQAEELRQELEKLQAAQEDLRRQHTQLEDKQEDTVQEGARARRELERRWVPAHRGSFSAPLGNVCIIFSRLLAVVWGRHHL